MDSNGTTTVQGHYHDKHTNTGILLCFYLQNYGSVDGFCTVELARQTKNTTRNNME
jgi:hypothetical protein